ncbi:hypothetical protein [Butyricicoccus sp. OF10-2]|uniref:hypothetical protein n=1 Tax=Butyricicoccus sp. OF10-2 TaxID=2292298 RepID=UPI000E5D0CB0|nr:hypothetical protein [Butyricicoccus sp. OF10-2]RHV81447.1 hypothetical protein DXB00_11370 [Butyricicoccus sp. OF10-2]
MLGVNQLDFINYCNALKGNYRKGVHKMETLLENPTHAKEFASNLGGVSVVLGTPVGKEDRNSETLRSMLLASDVANDAVYTWMGQYYEFDSWDELLGDEDRCKAMMANELLWRALSASGVAMGKTVATLAGLSCSAYDDMSAVAASSTAMTAIASSQTAMAAIFRSSTAMTAVQNNASAWAIFSNASSAVMGKTVAELAGLNPSGYADMNAIASSSTAMAAIATSSTAMSAISASTTAINALKASPLLVAKTKSGNNWTTETVRSGRGIAVYIYGASVSGGNGWVKTDNVQTTFSSNGTNQNLLKAFQTSLSVYWYQNSSTLYYIPC